MALRGIVLHHYTINTIMLYFNLIIMHDKFNSCDHNMGVGDEHHRWLGILQWLDSSLSNPNFGINFGDYKKTPFIQQKLNVCLPKM